MAGISSNALKGANYPENRKKYNGIEYTSELDLDIYDAQLRNLDPQIGRWNQIDPKIENMEAWSPYASNYDNPIRYKDFLGDEPDGGPGDGPYIPYAGRNGFAPIADWGAQVMTGLGRFVDAIGFGNKTRLETPVSTTTNGAVTKTTSIIDETKTEVGTNFTDYLSYMKYHNSNEGNPVSLLNIKTTQTTTAEQKTEVKVGQTTITNKVQVNSNGVTVENGVKTNVKVEGIPLTIGGTVATTTNGDRRAGAEVSTNTGGAVNVKANATLTGSKKGTKLELGLGVQAKTPSKITITNTSYFRFGW